jgi:hypothetical protein
MPNRTHPRSGFRPKQPASVETGAVFLFTGIYRGILQRERVNRQWAAHSAAHSVRSLSPFGERVGVRGLQNYRETLTPHPTPLPAGEGADRVRRSSDFNGPNCSLVMPALGAGIHVFDAQRKARRGCPAAQTSLRSLRKLDCVAGHERIGTCTRITPPSAR